MLAMALVDSKAAFESHCDRVDGSGWLKNILSTNGLHSFSELAFAVGTPQTPPTAAEFDAFCNSVNGGVDMTLSESAKVKRLHFEACTMIIAHTKQQVSGDTGVDGVRKLPVAEKQARLLKQQQRLTGVAITGELQPSYALIDLAASMLENNSVIWIAPSKCSKRETEIQMTVKEKTAVVALEQQTLKVTAAEVPLKVDNTTELQLQWSLMRRGIALDQCRLVEWKTHQLWVQYLLNLLSKPAPEGYNRVRMDQLVKADRELFLIMAEDFQVSGKNLADGAMDAAMHQLKTDPRITMHLLPLPVGRTPASSSSVHLDHEGPGKSAAPKMSPRKPKKSNNKQSQKAKASCPAELKEYKQTDEQGRAICWAFNMKSGCKEAVSQGRCKKGMHICIKCGRANHSVVTCRVGGSN